MKEDVSRATLYELDIVNRNFNLSSAETPEAPDLNVQTLIVTPQGT